MKLNNPVLIQLLEKAINQRAIVEMNDICARLTFICSGDLSLVIFIGYAFDEPVPVIWCGETISDETRMTPESLNTLMDSYVFGRGFS